LISEHRDVPNLATPRRRLILHILMNIRGRSHRKELMVG
jgi:hypothetical protein